MQIHRPKSRYFVQRSLGLSLCAVVVLGLAAASQAAGPKVRRARLPQFPQNVTDTFFPDANSKLVGPRPTAGAAKASVTPQETRPSTTADAAPSGSETWSKLISAEAVEDEIKSRQVLLAKAVQNATRFKSGENQQARTELGILATMLAIVAEYDGNIRWQRDAAAMRDVLARAGSNCKVASDAAYQDAAQRGEELQNLIRGDTPSFPAPAGAVEWPRLADRSELMKRLEQAEQQAIAPAVASEAAFKKNTDKLLHDAQITAALADVITRPGFEYADDETYLQHAHAMREQAKLLRDAALQGNYQQARQAAGALGQTCTTCHEGYRS